MLKVVFFTLLITVGAGEWFGVQIAMFLGSLMLVFCGLSEFFMSGVGVVLGVDFLGFVLIILRF